MFYRDLGAKLYNTIGLPNSILLGDASKGALTFRDVVTLTLVSLLITGVTVVGRSRQAQANLRRLSAAGPAVAAVSTSSGGGIGSGALIGLILAGPIGALIGAALGAASEKSETNDAYESALAEARYAVSSNSLMRRAFERFMFCMLVGSLIIAIHLNHTLLEALFRSINEAIQTFSRDGMSGIRQVLGLPVR